MVTHQLQVERRTGKVLRPETDVLPLCHATNLTSRQPKIQQNKTTLVQLPLTTLGQETRWAYSTTPPSPHGAGNSLRQTVHTHRACVHQAAKLVAALLRVAGVTAGLAQSNGSLPLGL